MIFTLSQKLMETPTAILFTVDSTGNKSSGIDYHTGESVELDVCDRLFVDIHLNFKEGRITHLGSLGTFTTYLVEVL